MSVLFEVVVIFAAVLFIMEQLAKRIDLGLAHTIKRHIIAAQNLHEESYEAIKPTFELWWMNGQKDVVLEKLREKLVQQVPGAMSNLIPDEIIDQLLMVTSGPALDEVRQDALHVAVHAHMREREDALFRKMPRLGGFRQRMEAERHKHEEELDLDRQSLMDAGINPLELEELFVQRA